MNFHCKRCNKELKESDPDAQSVTVGQNMSSHFVHELYHRECLAKDHIDALQEKLEKAEARVKELEGENKILASKNFNAYTYRRKIDNLIDTNSKLRERAERAEAKLQVAENFIATVQEYNTSAGFHYRDPAPEKER